jgi:23S rRNA pseudouridine1911/1915/1917 synthase
LDTWAELTRDRAEVRFAPEDIHFTLPALYEDEHILAVNKPAGVTVHPVQGMAEPTVVDYLRANAVLLADTGEALKPGIVHRLDKGTSGVLLIAKDTPTHARLQELFERRQVRKHYLAVTMGSELPEMGCWEYKLARNPKHRELFMAASEGRDSLTYYKMLAANALCSFVLLRIITGRTHQIRAHLKENGHAIIGDCDYGKGANVELEKFLSGGMDESLRRAWTEALPEASARAQMRDAVRSCPGFFLHAYSLRFTHPFTGAEIALLAPLPDYFTAVCAVFGWEAPVDPNALLAVGGVDA